MGSDLWLSEQDPILPAEVVVRGADDKDGCGRSTLPLT